MNYKGHEITLNPVSGRFEATVLGSKIQKPSFDAMKKYIDRKTSGSFAPFTALRESDPHRAGGHRLPYVSVKVIDVRERPRAHWDADRYRMIVEGETDTYDRLYEDTPENRTLLEAISAHRAEDDKIKKERRAQLDALRAKLSTIVAASLLHSRKPK